MGLVLTAIFIAILLTPLPLPYAPSSLMSLSDPLTGVWGSVYTARYPTQGKVVLPGLKDRIMVVIDSYGVPHVFAKSELDFAYALGYLHAHDRLFQMDFQRRLVDGRLSEVMGEAAYDVDLFYRTIGLYRGAQKSIGLLEKVARGERIDYYPQLDVALIKDDAEKLLEMMEAYSKGVNIAMEEMKKDNALPMEFKLLGYVPEKWTPLDCLKIGRLVAWGLTGTFADLELYLIYSGLVARYGKDFGTRLFLEVLPIDRPIDHFIVPEGEKFVHPVDPIDPPITASLEYSAVAELLAWHSRASSMLAPLRSAFASNNWVVGSELTDTSKPILCNDPHLSLTVPPVWYEVHYVVEGPGGEVINARGVTFPGIGLMIIGCTQYVGWGFTNVMADHMDFYYYKWNDKGQYLYKGLWRDVENVEDVIKVKTSSGYEERKVKLNFTVHGPIIENGGAKFAVCWMGERYGSLEALALYKYAHAKSAKELLKYTYYFQMPPQNHVFADVYGNFGWRAAGWYPNRTYPNGTRAIDASRPETALIPRLPINGSSEDVVEWNLNDWIDANEAPTLWNPKQGYVVTANNRLVGREYPYTYDLAWTFADYYRAYRIDELIKESVARKGKITIDDMKSIQNDVFFVPADVFIPEIEKALQEVTDEKLLKALSYLRGWNRLMLPDLVAPTIFVKWLEVFKNMTFTDEFVEMSATVKEFKLTRGQLMYLVQEIPTSSIEALVKLNPKSKWFDDVFTPEVEDATAIIRKSFEAAVKMLEKELGSNMDDWKFGKVHKLSAKHILGGVFGWFNYPAWEAWGWSDCVNNIGASGSSGPSWREILNFKDLNKSLCVIPGGQSGNPFSENYCDQLRMWLDGEYKQMSFPRASEQVEGAKSVLEFVPR
jgi:penicillin amidase